VVPSTAELLPEDGIEATTPPALDGAKLESQHGLKGAGTVEHPLVADGARVASSIGSSRTAVQSQELSPGRPVASPELGLFL